MVIVNDVIRVLIILGGLIVLLDLIYNNKFINERVYGLVISGIVVVYVTIYGIQIKEEPFHNCETYRWLTMTEIHIQEDKDSYIMSK